MSKSVLQNHPSSNDGTASAPRRLIDLVVYTARTDGSNHLKGWPDLETALAFLAQSVHVARSQFARVVLHADAHGAKLFAPLGFHEVIPSLDALGLPPVIRCAAKLDSYARQRAPFLHLDWDFILWDKRSEQINHPVVAQSGLIDDGSSTVSLFWHSLPWKPAFIDTLLAQGVTIELPCPAILGGTDHEFLRWYAELALEILRHPKNQIIHRWVQGELRETVCIALEQWLLGACAWYRGIEVQYLTEDPTCHAQTADPQSPGRLGFTHLSGGAKGSEYWRQEIRRLNNAAHLSPSLKEAQDLRPPVHVDLSAIPFKVFLSLEKHLDRRENALRQFRELGLTIKWIIPVRIEDIPWGPAIRIFRQELGRASRAC